MTLRVAAEAWLVTCAKCRKEAPLNATTLESARTAAAALDWMPQARAGQGLAKWKWLCPTCKPRPHTGGFGRST